MKFSKMGLLMCSLMVIVVSTNCGNEEQDGYYYYDTSPTSTNLGIHSELTSILEEDLDGDPVATPTMVPTFVGGDVSSASVQPTQIPPAIVDPPESYEERLKIIQVILQGRPHQIYAELMLEKANKYGIDFRALPVISILESGAGVQVCGYNATGYASCRTSFNSWEENYDVTARTLASYGGGIFYQLCVWNQGPIGCSQGLAQDYLNKAHWILGE